MTYKDRFDIDNGKQGFPGVINKDHPSYQSFIDRFHEEMPEVSEFKVSYNSLAGQPAISICFYYPDNLGYIVDLGWKDNPDTLDQAIEEMKGKIDG